MIEPNEIVARLLEKISVREKAPPNWETIGMDDLVRYISRILLRLWIDRRISDTEFKAATAWLEDQKFGSARLQSNSKGGQAPALIQEIWGELGEGDRRQKTGARISAKVHRMIVADAVAINRGSR